MWYGELNLNPSCLKKQEPSPLSITLDPKNILMGTVHQHTTFIIASPRHRAFMQLAYRRHLLTLETSPSFSTAQRLVLAHSSNPRDHLPAATSQRRCWRQRRHHRPRWEPRIRDLHSPTSQARLERPLLQRPRPLLWRSRPLPTMHRSPRPKSPS